MEKDIRPEIAEAHPFWPLGLPGWDDTWIAQGLRGPQSTFVTVWRRGPADETSRELTVPHLRGAQLHPSVLHPTASDRTAQWNAAEGKLTVSLPRSDTAVLLRLS